jgi:hypothetical protein
MKLHCCYIDCPREADYVIEMNKNGDRMNYLHSCMEHVGKLLTSHIDRPRCRQWTVTDLDRELTHLSSCAVHNAPAFPVGECDCGAIEQTEKYLSIINKTQVV